MYWSVNLPDVIFLLILEMNTSDYKKNFQKEKEKKDKEKEKFNQMVEEFQKESSQRVEYMYKNYPVIKESIKSDLIQMRDEIKKISNFINVYAPSTDPDNIALTVLLMIEYSAVLSQPAYGDKEYKKNSIWIGLDLMSDESNEINVVLYEDGEVKDRVKYSPQNINKTLKLYFEKILSWLLDNRLTFKEIVK